MKLRAYILAIIALIISSNANAIAINGDISISDDISSNSFGQTFYYDLYYFSVDVAKEIELFVDFVAGFAPYLAIWDGDFSPIPDWFSPPPITDDGSGVDNELLYIKFLAQPGINYQAMVSTYFYNDQNGNPPGLGSYTFFVTAPPDADGNRDESGIYAGLTPASVPMSAPGSILLMLLGLLALWFAGNHSKFNIRNQQVSSLV